MNVAPAVQDHRVMSTPPQRTLRRQDAFKQKMVADDSSVYRLERPASPVPDASTAPPVDLRYAVERSRHVFSLARLFMQQFLTALVNAVVGLIDRVLSAALDGIDKR